VGRRESEIAGDATPATRILVASVEEAHFLSVQVALDAHGIWHSDHRDHTEGVTKFSNSIIVDAADFDRATALIGALQKTAVPIASWERLSFRVFAVVATALVLGSVLFLIIGSR
jgi:hypothetical protein